MTISPGTEALPDRSFSIMSSRLTCRSTSCSTMVSIRSRACTPLISTRAPLAMEMFTSCLMVPRPRLTLPVERSSMPMVSATSLAWAGDTISGSVPISTSGMPCLSSEYITLSTLSPTFWAASSSRHSTPTPTFPWVVSMYPPVDTRAVRWNPDVLEPSMTILRIVNTSSNGSMFMSLAICSVRSSASRFNSLGGSSSFSTRHVVS